jgi:hypothetical protein
LHAVRKIKSAKSSNAFMRGSLSQRRAIVVTLSCATQKDARAESGAGSSTLPET